MRSNAKRFQQLNLKMCRKHICPKIWTYNFTLKKSIFFNLYFIWFVIGPHPFLNGPEESWERNLSSTTLEARDLTWLQTLNITKGRQWDTLSLFQDLCQLIRVILKENSHILHDLTLLRDSNPVASDWEIDTNTTRPSGASFGILNIYSDSEKNASFRN